jgi:RNA-directed DNA polymerase
VLDTDGPVLPPVTGTPQGGTGSPVLAQGFLPYVLDRWGDKGVHRHCRGAAGLMRYADDFVCAFEAQADAERFSNVRGRRLEKFGLELAGATPRLIPCRRYRQAGKRRIELLGCAVRWGKGRKGKEPRKRRTARKQLRSALTRFTAGCTEHRPRRRPVLFQRLNAQLRGYSKYDGVHGNAASRQEVCNKALRILCKWLNRRRQRPSDTWQGSNKVLERFKVARPRIVGRPKTRQAALQT